MAFNFLFRLNIKEGVKEVFEDTYGVPLKTKDAYKRPLRVFERGL
jgi:hypothetical protein